ncbi:MAG: flagellar protein FlgN [Planctomycetota bacterium]|jgi:hypothetical protein
MGRRSVAPALESGTGSGPAEHLGWLERTLREQLDGHRQLLGCIGRKREAVRTADMESIAAICQQEHAIAHRLTELEKIRLELVGSLTEVLHPEARSPLTVSQIGAVLEEPDRTRLSALAGQLRSLVQEARHASSVVRSAAEALARHMAGISQTVQSALSRTQVYSQRGRITSGTQCRFQVDVTS